MLGITSVTIDPTKVGVHVNERDPFAASFGIYLPNITYAKGYEVVVRIIHEKDQFHIDIPAKKFLLTFDNSDPLGLWHTTIKLDEYRDEKSSFGTYGTYLYGYTLLRRLEQKMQNIVTLPVYNPVSKDRFDMQANVISPFVIDPFATATGIGKLSAFTISDQPLTPFQWADNAFKVPPLDDLIAYELQIEEFAGSFDGVVQRLDYLTSLGVNVLELMPITHVPEAFDWGHGPLHYFSPANHWGGGAGLKRMVNACHERGIAVILDAVYQHVHADFAYNQAYKDSGEMSPMGTFPHGPFGPMTTFPGFPFTQEYFHKVNQYWLQEYHVDGFRYDDAPDYYDGPTGEGYAKLVYQTYHDSLELPRFQDPQGVSRIIQCAEFLKDPPAILRQTYSNTTWQDALLNKVEDMARNQYVDQDFVNMLNPYALGYPASRDFDEKQAPVAPFQYLNSHDHEHLITNFGVKPGIGGPGDLEFGDRANTPRLQPYIIALYTCQGIPMLWQGEELAENYTLPPGANARISTPRSMRWEYFYDQYGQGLIRLYRILARLRRQIPALRSREFHTIAVMPETMTVAYERQTPTAEHTPQQNALVLLNFSNSDQGATIPFSKAGTYREMINNDVRSQPWEITVHNDGDTVLLTIPSNYGYVFVSPLNTLQNFA
jgi:1,4-alpha-glucan branching enzyme